MQTNYIGKFGSDWVCDWVQVNIEAVILFPKELGMSMGSLGRGGKDGCCHVCCQGRAMKFSPTAGQERSNRGSKGSHTCQGSDGSAQVQVDVECICTLCTISDGHLSTQMIDTDPEQCCMLAE